MPKYNKQQRRPRKRVNPYPSRQSRYPSATVRRQPFDELKQYAGSAGYQSVFDGAGSVLLNLTNGITQGVSDSQRVGDHIYLESVEFRVITQNQGGATANLYTNYRLWLFQFFGDNNTLPLVGSFLLSSSANEGTTAGSMSFLNIDYAEQYLVLHQSPLWTTVGTYALADTGVPAVQNAATYECKADLSRADRNIRYYSGGAFGPNAVYALLTTDQSSVATNPSFTYGYKLRYTDA
jgi:hypothetical protein